MSREGEGERPMKKLTHHRPHLLSPSTPLVILIPLFFHFLPSSSPSSSHFEHRLLLQQHPSSSSTRRILPAMEEDKARLWSTPPSCYNKCNGCHPCLAVQVPTLPISLRGRRPSRRRSSAAPATGFLDPSPEEGSLYSNYKPLGWKCRCRNHLFNP